MIKVSCVYKLTEGLYPCSLRFNRLRDQLNLNTDATKINFGVTLHDRQSAIKKGVV